MSDMRKMQVGQIVDFVISYNKRQEEAERMSKRKQKPRRLANQNDINNFFG